MPEAMAIGLLVFLLIVAGTYNVLIIHLANAWEKAGANDFSANRTDLHPVSVVIAFKNEDQAVHKLLEGFENLNNKNAEIIFINDHSSDPSPKTVATFVQQHQNARLYHLPTGMSGKKAALSYGIHLANHEIIVVTDADCTVPKDWLTYMCIPFSNEKVKMATGMVGPSNRLSFSNALYFFDFIALVVTGLGSVAAGKAMYCNAASMAFRKAAYLDYEQNKPGWLSISGDDVFLLHHIKKKYGRNAIVPVIQAESLVKTALPHSIKAFLLQRLRWASKSKFYQDRFTQKVGILVFLTNGSVVATLVMAMFLQQWFLFIVLLALKSTADAYLFAKSLSFFGPKNWWPVSILLQPLYSIYIFITAPLSLLINSLNWKGTKHHIN